MKSCQQQQRGLSLIEMMIAMVVSLVLIAGVGTVYFSSKRTYQTRDQLSIMDENARVALNTLTKHLEHAGYTTAARLPMGKYMYVNGDPAPVSIPCGSTPGGNSMATSPTLLASHSTRDGTGTFGDSIGIRFLGDDELFTDCANGQLPVDCRVGAAPSVQASIIYNTLFVDNDSNGVPNLRCIGSRSGTTKSLAEGIHNIQFLYGLDSDDDGAVDKYVRAGAMTAVQWQQVISIKVGLLVRSLEAVFPANESRTYQILDTSVTTNDRYQRAVYTAVIQLRNVVEQ